MLATVDFNHQSRAERRKVDNIARYGRLPAEMEAKGL